jgi:signal transduction histidine kinase/CheY-like chemotaxis protein
VVVLVNLFIYSLAGWYLYHSWREQAATIAVLTQNMALAQENSIVGSIGKADMALRSVVDEAEQQLATGGIRGTELEAMLTRQAARVPGLNSLWVLDARGDLILGPRDSHVSPVNSADRDYFRWLRDNPGGGLALTKAVKGRVTKQWVMNLARRLNNPDGSFAGVVLGSFSVEYLTKLFAGINLGTHGTISLRYSDLEGIARYPEPQGFGSTIGQKSTMKELIESVQAGKSVATFTGRASVDQVIRTYSYRKFPELPLYILVGRAPKDYLGTWREEAEIIAALLLIFSLMTVMASLSLAKTWRLELQTEADLQQANRDLEERVTVRTDELSRSNDQLRDLIAGNSDGMVVISPEGVVCFANPAAQALLKKPLEQLVDQPFGLPVADTGSTEIDLVLPGGQICTVDMRVGATTWLTSPAFLVSLRDTTERKRVEEALATAKEAAEAATRTKSVFLANMSHEIRTPMNAIVGFGHLLRQTDLTPRQQDYLYKIEASSRTLLGIINDILDLSKVEAGRLELEQVDFSLHEVLDQVAVLITEQSRRKGLELIFTLEPGTPDALRGDPLRLEQVLLNLLSNAVKFSEQGQVVLSVATCIPFQADRVGLTFSVKDPGIGLSSEQIAKLFHPFSQADGSTTRRYGGTGLGLSICKHLVELMGGIITGEGEPGHGCTFTFTACFGFGTQPTVTIPEAGADAAGTRVLVVDDIFLTAKVLSFLLTELSYRVTIVTSGREALTELSTAVSGGTPDPYQLVFLDWQMPDLDGLEVARLIRDELRFAEPPTLIMTSAFGSEELRRHAVGLGITAFLDKPILRNTLHRCIFQALGDGTGPAESQYCAPPLTKELQGIRGARVLLVEDHPINQQLAREILEQVGMEVQVADNGAEAVSALEQPGEPPFELVFMDIQMPVMDGYEATRIIRKRWSGESLPIIAMTANVMAEEREECRNAGMNDHLGKPINVGELHRQLVAWIKPRRNEQPLQERLRPLEPAGAFPAELPGIDLTEGLARMNGNHDLYRKLLRNFGESTQTLVAELRKVLVVGDLEQARRMAHQLKGVAGNLSATGVFTTARDLEAACRAERKEEAQQILSLLEERLSEIRVAVATLGDTETSGERGEADDLTPEEVLNLVAELGHCLERRNLQALELMTRLSRALAQGPHAETVAALARSVEGLDFPSALRRLEKLSRVLSYPPAHLPQLSFRQASSRNPGSTGQRMDAG